MKCLFYWPRLNTTPASSPSSLVGSSVRWGDVTVLEKFTELGPGRTVEAPHTVQHCNTDGDLDHNTTINHYNPTHYWSHTAHCYCGHFKSWKLSNHYFDIHYSSRDKGLIVWLVELRFWRMVISSPSHVLVNCKWRVCRAESGRSPGPGTTCELQTSRRISGGISNSCSDTSTGRNYYQYRNLIVPTELVRPSTKGN